MKQTVLILLYAALSTWGVTSITKPPTQSLILRAPVASLHQKQTAFAALSAELISHAQGLGYEVTLGEAWRSAAVAAFKQWYADHGKGVANSLHTQRLALDINLFKNGKFLTRTEDYQALGEWWEQQSTDQYQCRWGGRFKKLPDGNHFSIEHEGVK